MSLRSWRNGHLPMMLMRMSSVHSNTWKEFGSFSKCKHGPSNSTPRRLPKRNKHKLMQNCAQGCSQQHDSQNAQVPAAQPHQPMHSRAAQGSGGNKRSKEVTGAVVSVGLGTCWEKEARHKGQGFRIPLIWNTLKRQVYRYRKWTGLPTTEKKRSNYCRWARGFFWVQWKLSKTRFWRQLHNFEMTKKNQWAVLLKCVKYMAYKLYLNKTVKKWITAFP